ncbi:MAG: hypothetical protein U5L04_02385 [Trueperaceae bacterium]|nr:hypothetical protein [Trueperaceae bacterium]
MQLIKDILDQLDQLGLDYTTDDDRWIDVPGYGSIYLGDPSTQTDLVVEGPDGRPQQVDVHEVIGDLKHCS